MIIYILLVNGTIYFVLGSLCYDLWDYIGFRDFSPVFSGSYISQI